MDGVAWSDGVSDKSTRIGVDSDWEDVGEKSSPSIPGKDNR